MCEMGMKRTYLTMSMAINFQPRVLLEAALSIEAWFHEGEGSVLSGHIGQWHHGQPDRIGKLSSPCTGPPERLPGLQL